MKCFETLRVHDGKISHIDYHNRRLNDTRNALWGENEPLDLRSYISPPLHGLYRCKVIYGPQIEKVEFHPYTPQAIASLKLIEAAIDYPYKFLDRRAIDEAFAKRGSADDILIVKEGLITDTSKANIAFFYKGRWLTPAIPLLQGTTRARLLDLRVIDTAYIEISDIKKFEKIALLNAMIGFFELQDCIIF